MKKWGTTQRPSRNSSPLVILVSQKDLSFNQLKVLHEMVVKLAEANTGPDRLICYWTHTLTQSYSVLLIPLNGLLTNLHYVLFVTTAAVVRFKNPAMIIKQRLQTKGLYITDCFYSWDDYNYVHVFFQVSRQKKKKKNRYSKICFNKICSVWFKLRCAVSGNI